MTVTLLREMVTPMQKTTAQRQSGFRQRLKEAGGRVTTVYLDAKACKVIDESVQTMTDTINAALHDYGRKQGEGK